MKSISKLFFSNKEQNSGSEDDSELWARYKRRKDYRVMEILIKKYMYLVR